MKLVLIVDVAFERRTAVTINQQKDASYSENSSSYEINEEK